MHISTWRQTNDLRKRGKIYFVLLRCLKTTPTLAITWRGLQRCNDTCVTSCLTIIGYFLRIFGEHKDRRRNFDMINAMSCLWSYEI